jgi:hypothetical protein
VGTTSPGRKLSIADSVAPTLGFYRGSTEDGLISSEAAGLAIQTFNNTPIQFSVVSGSSGYSERARIDSSGRLLVGASSARSNFFNTTSLSASFQIEGVTSSSHYVSFISSNSTGNEPACLILGHQKSGSIGGNTLLGSGDATGRISFQGSDGAQFLEAAAISCDIDGTPSGDDMPGRLVFATTADGAASPTERMRLDSSGRLGLGTSSPGARFHCVGGSTAGAVANAGIFTGGVELTAGSGARIFLSGSPGNETIRGAYIEGVADTNVNDHSLRFGTNVTGASPVERMRIDPQGRVGIGTTAPGEQLVVSGGALQVTGALSSINRPSSSVMDFLSGATRFFSIGADSSTHGQFIFQTSTTTSNLERARIDSSGRLLVGTSTASKNADRVTGNKIALVGVGAAQYPSHVITGYSDGNNDAGPLIELQKSRGASDGSMTAVVSGDRLGSLQFLGSDGTNFLRGASIASYVDNGADGTALTGSEMPGRLVFSVSQDGSASPTERLRINNIGTHFFFSGGTDTLIVRNANAANTSNEFINCLSDGTGITSGGSTSFRVYTNGNVQNANNSYSGISDAKLKENIVDAGSQWDDLKAFQVRKFNFKEGQTHTQIGLVAQEVELVSPGLVTESPDRDAEGNDLGTVTKSVNYSVLYMKAVKALQEAMERIEQLEAKVAALEGA